jgi:surface polysaccharide O-acyltransferase-like enzyme
MGVDQAVGEPNVREQWVDFVRASGAAMVVVLHSAAPWLYRYGKSTAFDWHVANLVDSSVRSAVPIFVMLSGYLLINKRCSLFEHFKKRASRIVLPWLFWSAVYVWWDGYRNHFAVGPLYAVRMFVSGNVYYHLWFVYVLLGLYFFVPIICWMLGEDGHRRSVYFIAIWFLVASIVPYAERVSSSLSGGPVEFAGGLDMFGGYSGYLVLGSLAGGMHLSKRAVSALSAVLVLALGVTAVATAVSTSKAGAFVSYYYGNLAPNIVVMSLCTFVLLKWMGKRLGRIQKIGVIVQRISSASFGIYLVHPMCLDMMRDGHVGDTLLHASQGGAVGIAVISASTFLAAFAISHIMLMVPILRKVA